MHMSVHQPDLYLCPTFHAEFFLHISCYLFLNYGFRPCFLLKYLCLHQNFTAYSIEYGEWLTSKRFSYETFKCIECIVIDWEDQAIHWARVLAANGDECFLCYTLTLVYSVIHSWIISWEWPILQFHICKPIVGKLQELNKVKWLGCSFVPGKGCSGNLVSDLVGGRQGNGYFSSGMVCWGFAAELEVALKYTYFGAECVPICISCCEVTFANAKYATLIAML